jgi:hypothetical protein
MLFCSCSGLPDMDRLLSDAGVRSDVPFFAKELMGWSYATNLIDPSGLLELIKRLYASKVCPCAPSSNLGFVCGFL